ncbi:MAG: phosphoribosylanthranilate isomerase [Leptolyngbyaceae cyanobacterium CRU_2_3]|nr:phosphoribosylanthranilate isomerase [Leptolyngbyaceae cyanobacterium CRU_2_3]
MRTKICGITQPAQGQAIAQLGATALGFICVRQSPRYVTPEQIGAVVAKLPVNADGQLTIDRVGVFVNPTLEDIVRGVAIAHLNAVQLHGNETPQFCQQLRAALPSVEIIKALRVHSHETLQQVEIYDGAIDTLLLDAFNPDATNPGLYGGTGKTLNWLSLKQFRPACPWYLAGGITPDNVLEALSQAHPDGIDVSSGVELAPGKKDLVKVAKLLEQLKSF